MSYTFIPFATTYGVNDALKLYINCLEIIAKGDKSCRILVDPQNTSAIAITSVVRHLRSKGFQAKLVYKTETEEDTFHNHTYEVEKTYLVVNVPKSKL